MVPMSTGVAQILCLPRCHRSRNSCGAIRELFAVALLSYAGQVRRVQVWGVGVWELACVGAGIIVGVSMRYSKMYQRIEQIFIYMCVGS